MFCDKLYKLLFKPASGRTMTVDDGMVDPANARVRCKGGSIKHHFRPHPHNDSYYTYGSAAQDDAVRTQVQRHVHPRPSGTITNRCHATIASHRDDIIFDAMSNRRSSCLLQPRTCLVEYGRHRNNTHETRQRECAKNIPTTIVETFEDERLIED